MIRWCKMVNIKSVLMGLASGILLAGCVSQSARIQDKEDLLAAAGFDAKPATNAARQAQLALLPPNHFVTRAHGDSFVYLYADPKVCDCLYIGNQAAYDRYKREMFRRQIATEQQLTADTYQNASWDWGPWGPGWWAGP